MPYVQSGTDHFWTRGPIDGNAGFFGISGRTFAEAFHNGGQTKGAPTAIGLIGTNSKHSNLGIWPSDRNNFAPAIGFAWSPGFGGKRQDNDPRRLSDRIPAARQQPFVDRCSTTGRCRARSTPPQTQGAQRTGTSRASVFRWLSPSNIPGRCQPIRSRTIRRCRRSSLRITSTPYVQTFTLGVTRSLPGNMILDVKYLGTRGVKLHSSINYNEPDFQYNGLLQALNITRAGGNAPMFDQMLNGLNFGAGIGVVGRDVTGSEALRRHASFRADIANGNFRNVANTLNTANIGVTVPAGQTIAGGTLRSSGLFPENFIVANPQFGTMEMRNNSDSSTYHSMETQLTMRPKHGITYQATWTWSRATGTAPANGRWRRHHRNLSRLHEPARRLHRCKFPTDAQLPRLRHVRTAVRPRPSRRFKHQRRTGTHRLRGGSLARSSTSPPERP